MVRLLRQLGEMVQFEFPDFLVSRCKFQLGLRSSSSRN